MISEEGLREAIIFHQEDGINQHTVLEDFLCRSQKFIDYEEWQIASKSVAKGLPKKEESRKEKKPKKEKENARESRGQISWYVEYTPFNTSRAQIYNECANTEFKEAGKKQPKFIKERP